MCCGINWPSDRVLRIFGARMWTTEIGEGERAGGVRIIVRRDSAAVSYAAVVEAWQSDAEFRAWFNALLAGAAFSAFRWRRHP